MVDTIGALILSASIIYTACIFTGYYILEDFTGIIAGTAVATAILYLPRNLIVGIIKTAIGG